MVLLEGLEGGRWALGWKTHHCLVDGVGSVDVIDLLLDRDPRRVALEGGDPVNGDARVSPAPGQPSRGRRGLLRPPEAMRQAAHAAADVAGAGVRAVAHPLDALDRSRALAELIVRDQIISAPPTSLNVPIGQTRRFGIVRVPLADVKAIGRELGGSVNDVVLAACAGGLRRLLLERGEEMPGRGLRAMVPVNVRKESGRGALGNQVSSLFVDLPVEEPDPRARLHAIATGTKRLKESGAAAGPRALIDLAATTPPVVLHAALARTFFSTRLFNITITNVPGSPTPLYAFGSKLREIHPFVPLAAQHAVGIAVLSYDGLLTFGIGADGSSTPDLDVLARGIEAGFHELRGLVPNIEKVNEETRF